MNNVLSKKTAIFILFLEGFISISIQMIMMRQLTPFVGSSVVVSSLIIGIFLLSLSYGYFVGGRKKKDHIKIFSYNVLISSFLLGLGSSYLVMKIFFYYSAMLINNALIELTIYLVIFLAPIVFLLGQTVPLLTNFYNSKSVSKIAGDSFAINTIGSVIGSVFTSLFLFHYLGMAATIFIDVILLGIVLVIIVEKNDRIWFASCFLLILYGSFHLNVDFEKNNFQLTNSYNNYSIKEDSNNNKYFIMNESSSSSLFNDNTNWPYINKMKEILFSKNGLELVNKNILILGAGGFTLSHSVSPYNFYTYVDIDKDIKDVAEKYFLEEKITGTFVAEDARRFVNNTNKKYDAIVVDLYSNKSSIPWHLLTNEFFNNVNNALLDDGHVLINIISKSNFEDNYSKNIYNTIINNFDYCLSEPLSYNNVTNIVYYCKKKVDEDKTIYVDDISRSAVEEIRNN